MQCLSCGRILAQPLGRGRRRKFCNPACKMRHQRGTLAPVRAPRTQARPDGPVVPALHHGRFEDYAQAYRGQIDVVIVDPPYTRAALPLYAPLLAFVQTVLVEGGYFLCMPGSTFFDQVVSQCAASALEFVAVIEYRLGGLRRRQNRQHTSTGTRTWQTRHKSVLWYEQPGRRRDGIHGRHPYKRLPGGIDVIDATGDFAQDRYPDQQSLAGFQALVSRFTTRQDVILDPMCGWGTTLIAALTQHRPHVIGIEKDRARYDYACEQVALAQAQREAYQRP